MGKARKNLISIFREEIIFATLVCILISLSIAHIREGVAHTLVVESFVGCSVYIEGDTLKILNYNYQYDTFELSDGSKITMKLVKDNLIK